MKNKLLDNNKLRNLLILFLVLGIGSCCISSLIKKNYKMIINESYINAEDFNSELPEMNKNNNKIKSNHKDNLSKLDNLMSGVELEGSLNKKEKESIDKIFKKNYELNFVKKK